MTSIKWLSLAMVQAIHDEAVYRFGRLSGVRDLSLLESAIDKPRNRLAYEPKSSIFDLAASLGAGLARSQAFSDDNMRTALLATCAFLWLNNQRLEPEEEDEVRTIIGLATGDMPESQFAVWLALNSASIKFTRSRAADEKRVRKIRARSKK